MLGLRVEGHYRSAFCFHANNIYGSAFDQFGYHYGTVSLSHCARLPIHYCGFFSRCKKKCPPSRNIISTNPFESYQPWPLVYFCETQTQKFVYLGKREDGRCGGAPGKTMSTTVFQINPTKLTSNSWVRDTAMEKTFLFFSTSTRDLLTY